MFSKRKFAFKSSAIRLNFIFTLTMLRILNAKVDCLHSVCILFDLISPQIKRIYEIFLSLKIYL